MAVKLNGKGDVLVFDILRENLHVHKNKASMPDRSSYFLFDGAGKLIYLSSRLDMDSPESRVACSSREGLVVAPHQRAPSMRGISTATPRRLMV